MSRKLRIAHLFPELHNLYGDGGNIITLQRRCEWRGIECEVVPVHFGHRPDFSDIDIAFIGGGSDREQRILSLRFFQGRTQMEVAGEIGISQAQVSRLEKAALSHMRKLV